MKRLILVISCTMLLGGVFSCEQQAPLEKACNRWCDWMTTDADGCHTTVIFSGGRACATGMIGGHDDMSESRTADYVDVLNCWVDNHACNDDDFWASCEAEGNAYYGAP